MGDGVEGEAECDWFASWVCSRWAMVQRSVDGVSACEEPGEGKGATVEAPSKKRMPVVQSDRRDRVGPSNHVTRREYERIGLPALPGERPQALSWQHYILVVYTTDNSRYQLRRQT